MADIPLTRTLAQAGQAAQSRLSGTRLAAPAPVIEGSSKTLSQTAVGTILKGKVATATVGGAVGIDTERGSLMLRPHPALQPGRSVTLQILSRGPQMQFQILSVDGHPPGPHRHGEQPAPRLAGAATGAAGSGKALPPPSSNTPVAGQISPSPPALGDSGKEAPPALRPHPDARPVIREPSVATVSRADPVLTLRGSLEAGTILPARIVSGRVDPVLPTEARLSGGQQGFSPNPSRPGLQAAAVAGDTLTLRVQPATGATSLAASAAPPGTLAGIVTGRADATGAAPGTLAGASLVATTSGVLALAISPPLATGTRLLFDVLAVSRAQDSHPRPLSQDPAGRVESHHQTLIRMLGGWPALDQALSIIGSGGGTGEAAGERTSVFPMRPGAGFASAVFFLLAALRQGDLSQWMGAAALARLESAKPEAARRLAEDFTRLGRLAGEPSATGWHILPLPVHGGEGLPPWILAWRPHGGPKGEDDPGQRFIVEASFKAMGRIQLEGLVRRDRFDLVLRGETPSGQAMENDIRSIHTEALAISGLKGHLRFSWGRIPDPGLAGPGDARGQEVIA